MRAHSGLPSIHLIDASHSKVGVTRTFQLSIPHDTARVVIDAPAGMCKRMLHEMVVKADIIVVPVTPSPIDIHASSEFIYELKLILNACRQPYRDWCGGEPRSSKQSVISTAAALYR